ILVLRGGIEGVSAYGDTATEPYSSRVFLGGVSDLRGFGYHTVSPVDEEGRLTGGETAWFATLEYLYPVNRIVDMAIYYDVGDVSASGYDTDGPVSNWGLGFMIRADNFPVRFDVAFPLSTYTLDTNNEIGDARISFSAGYTY
ncbi:MAG: BamA/TamA family outer membrane protein, partial [Kiritimatiellia bacterium]